MESLMQLFFEWEIQLLVLLSFFLQIFLLFIGSLRRRSNNMLLRLSIWIAYLGADTVAVYALVYVSRNADATTGKDKLKAFFWAPFLLIHLGKQDTITAFAIEDNNLWLRHLLTLMVQAILVLYVFWKSIGWHSMELEVPGIFVFLVGIIKSGEITGALKCGTLKSLRSSTGHRYRRRLPKVIDGDVGYSNTVCDVLHSMLSVQCIFAAHTYFRRPFEVKDIKRMPKMMEIQLDMLYDDLYTKALVLRTRSGIILRCISEMLAVVAFVLFFLTNKQRYSGVDVAITYVLFIGGLFLEVCAVFAMVVTSPWTWAWLEAREYHRLAHMSWLLCSIFGWPEKRPLWSHSMGQCNLVSSLAAREKPRSCNQRLISKTMYLVDAVKEHLFSMPKLLKTRYVKVDKELMDCVVMGIYRLSKEIEGGRPRQWPKLGPLLEKTQGFVGEDFGTSILNMHVLTEVYLSKYGPPPPSDTEANTEAKTKIRRNIVICRKLSSYMIHLLVNQSSMLPLRASVEATLQLLQESLEGAGIISGNKDKNTILRRLDELIKELPQESLQRAGLISGNDDKNTILRRLDELIKEPTLELPQESLEGNNDKDTILRRLDELIKRRLNNRYEPALGEETLEEITDVWVGLLLYAAGKSQPEEHAAQLGRGGELLTFAWLLLAHLGLGDSGGTKIELMDIAGGNQAYAFHLLPGRSSP